MERSVEKSQDVEVWGAAVTLLCTVLGSALFAGCSSVEIPEESYYRLELPRSEVAAARSPGVLRVEGFELASTLNSDRLLVAESSVSMRAYEFHRWISPLERLVQDVMTVGLTRSKAFAEVKGPTQGPGENMILTGRILDFHQSGEGGEWGGKVTLELRLSDAEDRHVLLREEFTQRVAMPDSSPESAVIALSAGTAVVLDQFLARCGELGVLRVAAAPGK